MLYLLEFIIIIIMRSESSMYVSHYSYLYFLNIIFICRMLFASVDDDYSTL